MEQIAFLVLKRPYRCIKCDRIQLGSIFLDFTLSRPRKPRRKKERKETPPLNLKCPECGGSVRRSRRHGVERLFFFAKAYRCSECEHRFRNISLG